MRFIDDSLGLPVKKPAEFIRQIIKPAEPVRIIKPAEFIRQIIKPAEPVRITEPVRIIKPAEPVRITEPVRIIKPAEPVRITEPVRIIKPVEVLKPTFAEKVKPEPQIEKKEDMGIFKKIGRGIKKFGSFTGKIAKGVANGGILGGVTAGITNLGGSSSKAQNLAFDTPTARLVGNNFTVDIETEKEKRNKMYLIGGGIVAVILAVIFFKRKR